VSVVAERAADLMRDLNEEQRAMVTAIREFVDRDVAPVVSQYDHDDEFPAPLVETMREMGLFGLTIPEKFGGLGLDLVSYALVIKELSRGWISLSGVINTHFMAAWMIENFGTEAQKDAYLPRMAAGEIRSAYSMTEPHAGSDVQSIRTRAVRDGDEWVIDGQKMWVTNGLRASMVMLLAVTDPAAEPRHRGMTAFIIDKAPGVAEQPGLTVPPQLRKLGYKGVESTELVFDSMRVPADAVLGGEAGIGRGFKYFMAAVELGRVNVAARGLGLATAAMEQAVRYARQRETFGVPISEHQAIQMKLAQMATKIRAAEMLVFDAAERKSRGERADMEAGMAKYFASETAHEVTLEAMRIHGGYGYSQEYPIERLYRDAPLLILGEGTNEIQQILIARHVLARY
jgi:alkylation response protein AidB-like acyl-CoA dehydrogenase